MKFRRQLFKYIDVNGALAMLSKGTLQFTNSFYFNDPFDCHPSLIDFSSNPVGRYGDVFKDWIRDEKRNTHDRLRENTWICSLSKIKDSLLMWSHYANYHQGFALEYNLRSTLSHAIPNVGIFPVIYDDKRHDGTSYLLWEFLKLQGISVPNSDLLSHIKCALYKSCQWEYEKEWRLIDSTIRDNIILENNTSVIIKPTAIYYGTNIPLADKKKLHEIALNKGIKEYDMYIDFASEKYEMLYRAYS